MRVLRDPEGSLDRTDEESRPITFRDFLTHRSGLTTATFIAVRSVVPTLKRSVRRSTTR